MAGNKTIQIPRIPSPVSQYDPVIKEDLSTLLEYHNEILTSGNKPDLTAFTFDNSFLTQSKFRWYTPVTHKAEVSVTGSSGGIELNGYRNLGDEITNIEVGSNGLIFFVYLAFIKSEYNVEGLRTKIRIYLNNTPVVSKESGAGVLTPAYAETEAAETWGALVSCPKGLRYISGSTEAVETGMALGHNVDQNGGYSVITVAPGTYTLTVRYSPSQFYYTESTMHVKDRHLWAVTFG